MWFFVNVRCDFNSAEDFRLSTWEPVQNKSYISNYVLINITVKYLEITNHHP